MLHLCNIWLLLLSPTRTFNPPPPTPSHGNRTETKTQKLPPLALNNKKKKQQPTGQNDYASGSYDHPEAEPAEGDFGLMQSDPDAGLDEATWESYPEKDFRGLQVVLRVTFVLLYFHYYLFHLFFFLRLLVCSFFFLQALKAFLHYGSFCVILVPLGILIRCTLKETVGMFK